MKIGNSGETYAERINTRKPWHPFSKPENRTDYFYRKMQQDNCLHTVVNVTLDFVTASTFPKVEDMLGSLFQGHVVRPGDAIDGLPQHLKVKLAKVVTGDGKKVRRNADRQQLYLVVLFGGFFDNAEAANGQSVSRSRGEADSGEEHPWEPVVRARLRRAARKRGLHGALCAARSSWPTMDRITAFTGDWKIARELWPKIQDEITRITSSMPFHARWTGSGGEKFGTAQKAWEVMLADGTPLL